MKPASDQVPTRRRERTGSLGPRMPQGTLYRGGSGMWSWVAQRITGVLVFMFLLVHVLDTSLVRVSPEAYNAVIATYKNPLMGVAEVGLVGAVAFHALNGLRVIAIDSAPWATRHHRGLLIVVAGAWIALMVPFSVRHLSNVFGA